MFPNTITLTINAEAKVLVRQNQDNFSSFYRLRTGDEEITLQIRHSTEGGSGLPVYRHNVFVERTVFATPASAERYYSLTVTMRDRRGTDPQDSVALKSALETAFSTLWDDLASGTN